LAAHHLYGFCKPQGGAMVLALHNKRYMVYAFQRQRNVRGMRGNAPRFEREE